MAKCLSLDSSSGPFTLPVGARQTRKKAHISSVSVSLFAFTRSHDLAGLSTQPIAGGAVNGETGAGSKRSHLWKAAWHFRPWKL
jgi:hypothetical protein